MTMITVFSNSFFKRNNALFNLTAIVTLLLWSSSCSKEQTNQDASLTSTETKESKPKHKRPIAVELGKIFEQNGSKMLFGGKDSLQHFDISNCELKDSNFHYGIGREVFPALLQPEFYSVEDADTHWNDTSRFLVAWINDKVKAYGVEDLTRHEVVNDSLGGRPIMAAYCILADLGAVYERTYGDQVFTFALSGYTYYDAQVWEGLDGFVLWDRETESLWWPLVGKSVSGPLKGVQLQEMNETNWKDTDWKSIKAEYPNAKVMKSGLDYKRPGSWPKVTDVEEIVKEYS